MTTVKRGFKMHPSLLRDLIKRQTGSLDRAVLEAVSNSVDAGAPQIHITLSTQCLVVRDDGAGFKSEEEIYANFETFGQLHTEQEAKVFGTFRMGRGQLFAYGKNTWKTNAFKLTVDIEKTFDSQDRDALGYELHPVPDGEALKGCEVVVLFYKPLTHSELVGLEYKLTQAVKWVATPILLNGKRVNEDPYAHPWQVKEDLFVADYTLNAPLSIYNLGVLVSSVHQSIHGLGGTVVSTIAMKLNFARNEADDTCPVWAAMKKSFSIHAVRLEAEALKDVPKKKKGGKKGDFTRLQEIPRLKVEERRARLKTIVQTGKPVDSRDFGQPLLLAFGPNTAWLSPRKLHKTLKKSGNYQVAFGYPSSTTVLRAVKLGLAHPLSYSNVSNAGVASAEDLVKGLNQAFNIGLKHASDDLLAEAIRKHDVRLKKEQMTDVEKVLTQAVRSACYVAFDMPVSEVHVAVLGDPEEQVKVMPHPSAYYHPVLVLGRDNLRRMTTSGLDQWMRLGYVILEKMVERDVQSHVSPAEDQKQAFLKAMVEHLPQVPMFARYVVDNVLLYSEGEILNLKKHQATILDTLTRYQAAGENLQLYKEVLTGLHAKLGKVLEGVSLREAGLTLEELMVA